MKFLNIPKNIPENYHCISIIRYNININIYKSFATNCVVRGGYTTKPYCSRYIKNYSRNRDSLCLKAKSVVKYKLFKSHVRIIVQNVHTLSLSMIKSERSAERINERDEDRLIIT